LRFFVQDSVQQRGVDFEVSVVADVAQLPKLFMKWLTRERVVPIICASVSWLTLAITGSGLPSLPKFANKQSPRQRAAGACENPATP
jgi:hypothetical protein